ncbi:hypothetical protein [Halocella sp. SP3-1]|nr:hypothetical protein [Halocella sp. SP3-1]
MEERDKTKYKGRVLTGFILVLSLVFITMVVLAAKDLQEVNRGNEKVCNC